jgi:hypothetical protein
MPSLLATGARSDEAGKHFSQLYGRSPSCYDWIALSEPSKFVLIVHLNYPETPRSPAIEDWAKDHHLSRFDSRAPVGSVPSNDLPLIVGHIKGKGRPWSLEPKNEGAHASESKDLT